MTADVLSLLQTGATLTDAALERLLPAPTVASFHPPRHAPQRLRRRQAPAPHPLHGGRAHGRRHGELPPGVADLGAAIEMLHTYSLIHDDLPALDNDDLRRGKPTCHVAFGEAIAILAGDALQTLAFQTIAQLAAPPATVVAILREISVAIGTGVGAPATASRPA